MCGISGFLSSSPALPNADNLLAKIIHRGPDDSGVFTDFENGVLLLHTRLSILDTSSHGHQPMTSEGSAVTLTYNGELYNYMDLRDELISQGYIFNSNSDTEVLLKLYLAYRNKSNGFNEMLNKLNGIFSFAIWDGDFKELYLARDAYGVKPLYYYAVGNDFVFSSEIKGLAYSYQNSSFHPPNTKFNLLSPASIDRYLTFLWCPGEGTPFANIKKLSPGGALRVKNGKVMKSYLWCNLPFFNRKHICLRSADHKLSTAPSKTYLIKKTEALLRTAVKRQLVSDVPVGAFLSGGLDSSSVVAFAREINPEMQCFTIDVDGTQEEGIVNDLPFARKVAKHLGVDLNIVKVDSTNIADDLVKMVYQLDEPLADPAPLNVLYICRLARENGIKVLLSGAGGDDIFTGYRRHRAISFENYISWIPDPILRSMESIAKHFDQRNPIFRRIHKFLNGSSLDNNHRIVNYFRWITRSELYELYSNEFKEKLGSNITETPMLNYLSDLPNEISKLNRMLALDQRFFLTDHNLNYTDKMSMAVGVEVRVPFLDNDLVRFAANLPDKLKQNSAVGKWILKKAM